MRKNRKSKSRRKVNTGAYQDSYNRKENSSAQKGILDFSKCKDKLAEYKPHEGLNKINIIPYEIKTKNHPLVKQGKMEVGDYVYNMDVWVHRFVGAGNEDIICPKKNYNKHCPICEERANLYDAGKDNEAKSLGASRRVFYNVQPIVKGEAQELCVWLSASHHNFEKELIEEANACENGEDILPFADPDEGSVVQFRATKQKRGKIEFFEFKSFKFKEREEEIEDEVLDEAISFDEFLITHTAEQIEEIFFGGDVDDEKEEDDEEEEKPLARKRKSKKEEIVEEDIEEEDIEEEDGEEENEEEEKPRKSKSKKNSKKQKCPEGFTFINDHDKYEECDECELWEECSGE